MEDPEFPMGHLELKWCDKKPGQRDRVQISL